MGKKRCVVFRLARKSRVREESVRFVVVVLWVCMWVLF